MANDAAARCRASSTSSVTATGRPTPTRGRGRPAASAAAVIDGAIRSPITSGAAIHVRVPSASSPATRSSAGPRAATRIGTGPASSTLIGPMSVVARSVSPFTSTGWPSSAGRRAERYSRRWTAGFWNAIPNIPSITSWWESPMPRWRRFPPPRAAEVVSACPARTNGWRG